MTWRRREARGAMRSGVDPDAPCRLLRPLRNHDLEHAVAARCTDAFGVGGIGQREAAMEQTARALGARQLAGLLGALFLALTLDRQYPLVHVDFDVVRVHTRNVGQD